jgi:hypothetical protein
MKYRKKSTDNQTGSRTTDTTRHNGSKNPGINEWKAAWWSNHAKYYASTRENTENVFNASEKDRNHTNLHSMWEPYVLMTGWSTD